MVQSLTAKTILTFPSLEHCGIREGHIAHWYTIAQFFVTNVFCDMEVFLTEYLYVFVMRLTKAKHNLNLKIQMLVKKENKAVLDGYKNQNVDWKTFCHELKTKVFEFLLTE